MICHGVIPLTCPHLTITPTEKQVTIFAFGCKFRQPVPQGLDFTAFFESTYI